MLDILIRKRAKANAYMESVDMTENTENQQVENNIDQKIEKFRTLYNDLRCIERYSTFILSELAKEMEISQGAFFISSARDNRPAFKMISGYALPGEESIGKTIELGEGFPGQAAKDGVLLNICNVPEGYLTIESGLGKSSSSSLLVFPVKSEDKVIAVIELASFRKFRKEDELFLLSISPVIGEQLKKMYN